MKKSIYYLITLFSLFLSFNFSLEANTFDNKNTPVIIELRELIKNDSSFRSDLINLLNNTQSTYWKGKNINDFIDFFAEWEVFNVEPLNVQQYITPIYDLYNSQEGNEFFTKNRIIKEWLVHFMQARGKYMDSSESLETLNTWLSDPDIDISQYIIPDNGFTSFNNFFTREIKRELRPVNSELNAIVTPADGYVWLADNNVTEEDSYLLKNDNLSVKELLGENPIYKKFLGGQSVIVYLQATDYHHFWSPVDGKIIEKKQLAGLYIADGNPYNVMNHRRAYYIFESENLGYIGLVVIGMYDISSIYLKKEKDDFVKKGTELGNFAYGGSEIIMFFQKDKADFSQLSPTPVSIMRVGEKIGTILK